MFRRRQANDHISSKLLRRNERPNTRPSAALRHFAVRHRYRRSAEPRAKAIRDPGAIGGHATVKGLVILLRFGPLFFGIGFLAPVMAAAIARTQLAIPFGLAPLTLGLIVGAAAGGLASFRRRWL